MEILYFSKILHIAGFSDVEVKKQIYLINSLIIANILATNRIKDVEKIQKDTVKEYLDNLICHLPISKKLLIEQTLDK